MKTREDKRFRDKKIKTTAHDLLPEAAIANRSRRVGHAHTLAAAVLAKATVGWHRTVISSVATAALARCFETLQCTDSVSRTRVRHTSGAHGGTTSIQCCGRRISSENLICTRVCYHSLSAGTCACCFNGLTCCQCFYKDVRIGGVAGSSTCFAFCHASARRLAPTTTARAGASRARAA